MMLSQSWKHLTRLTSPYISPSISKNPLSSLQRSFSTLNLKSSPTSLCPKSTLFSSQQTMPAINATQTRHIGDREELAKDGYGIKLYDEKTGRRGTLRAVEMRFKRLDWGAWIKTKGARYKKQWKKSHDQLVRAEKHTFCDPYHKRRFDRAVDAAFKSQRHLVDDPYRVYNNMSFQLYHSIKLRNMERIKKYGPKIYDYPQFKAHYSKNPHHQNKLKNPFYEPPGYHADVAEGDGVYSPDTTRPQNIMAPHYKLELRHESRRAMYVERKYWRNMLMCQPYYGEISLCSKLRLPVVDTKLG